MSFLLVRKIRVYSRVKCYLTRVQSTAMSYAAMASGAIYRIRVL